MAADPSVPGRVRQSDGAAVSAARPSGAHILGLDALRVFSAVAVVAFHLVFWFRYAVPVHPGFGGFPVGYERLAPAAWSGWVGVEIFFVLSGFVISASARNATPAAFLTGRLLRLLPGVWICSSVTFAVLLLFAFGPYDAATVLHRWLKSVTLAPVEPWLDSAMWTLGVELAFYGAVLILLRSGGFAAVRVGVVVIGLLSAGFWILNLGLALGAVPALPDLLSARTAPPTQRLQELLLLRHGCFFGLGTLIWLGSVGGRFSPALLVLAVPCLLGCLVEILAMAASVAAFVPVAVSWATPALIWAVAVAAIPVCVLFNHRLSRLAGAAAPAIRQAGLATFPLYLLHQTVGYTLLQGLRGLMPDAVILGLVLLGVGALSIVISLHLEPWLRAGLAAGLRRVPPLGIARAGFGVRGWQSGCERLCGSRWLQ